MRYGGDRIEMEVNGKETDSDEKQKSDGMPYNQINRDACNEAGM